MCVSRDFAGVDSIIATIQACTGGRMLGGMLVIERSDSLSIRVSAVAGKVRVALQSANGTVCKVWDGFDLGTVLHTIEEYRYTTPITRLRALRAA